MPVNAGKLDRPISIKRRVPSRDALGGASIALVDFMPEAWAEKVSLAGREFRAAGALRSETTIAFRIRHIPELDYDTGDFMIEHEGRQYDIVSVAEEGRRESQLMQCKLTGGAPA